MELRVVFFFLPLSISVIKVQCIYYVWLICSIEDPCLHVRVFVSEVARHTNNAL